jgi:hypothetical protein
MVDFSVVMAQPAASLLSATALAHPISLLVVALLTVGAFLPNMSLTLGK